MKRLNFNIKDRKVLYGILTIALVCVFTLTIAYAALSVTLNIQGNAQVVASSWDIHLDNVKVTSGSVSGNTPSITSPTTAIFSTTLTTPGDFYEFTIDVVNACSIDAMIDSITKLPTLTTAQAKYLNYIIEYQNGESINTKQLVSKKSFVRLKVRVEYRKDITASDLPTTSETLNLAFTVNYVQSDGTGSSIADNGVMKTKPKIISGNYDTTGSEICIGQECFYVLYSTDDTITMITKYNLHVGNIVTGKDENEELIIRTLENPTGIQDSSALGGIADAEGNNIFPAVGVVSFSQSVYWESDEQLKPEYGTGYPANVYDFNSPIFRYVENYKEYLITQGVTPLEARLLLLEEIDILGEKLGDDMPNWLMKTSFWLGASIGKLGAGHDSLIVAVFGSGVGQILFAPNDANGALGVRPVITISKSLF